MAQKYNPSTGQWEDDEEDNSLSGGLANAFGGGSAPSMDSGSSSPLSSVFQGSTPTSLADAVSSATKPYTGYTYYASGNQYYNPSQTSKYIDDFNTKFKFGITPEEISSGIGAFGESHRKQFGQPISAYNNATTANNQNYLGNFTNLSDPLAIARESVSNVLRTRGLSDAEIQSTFLNPLQSQSTASTDAYQKAADSLLKSQDDEYMKVHPDFMKGGSAFSDFFKNPVVRAMIGFTVAGLGGLFSGPGAAAAGAGATEAGGIGSLLGESAGLGFTPAAGLNFSPLSSLGSMAEVGAGLGGAGLSAGLGSLGEFAGAGGLGLTGDAGFISDLGSILGESLGQGFSPAANLDFSPLSSIGSTGIGAGPGGFGLAPEFGASSFSPVAEALSLSSPEVFGPPEIQDMPGQYIDDFGGGTNSLGEFTNGRGMMSPQDRIATSLRQLGMERGLAADLTQGGSKMFNFMTQSPGKAGMFKAPSPLEMLYKGGKAFMDYNSNKDAMGMYEDQLNKVRSYQDPNRARGDTANQLWQQNYQDPMAGYRDFMMGGGRDFVNQARAQAARGGKRGSYINSGKMNSDLASMYMKQQLARGDSLSRGFANSPNNEETAMKYMAPMIDMERNKYAPFGQAIDSIMRGFQLSDLFGG